MDRYSPWSAVFQLRWAALIAVIAGLIATRSYAVSETPAANDDKSAKTEKNPAKSRDRTKLAELKVVVRDSEGKPVVGAFVWPYAMRVKEQEGHGFWDDEKFGTPQFGSSDNQGIAVIRYPAKIESGAEVFTTRLLTFTAEHPDFVRQTVHFDLGPPQAEVILEPGCEVQISAVDDKGTAVPNFAVLMSGENATDQWVGDGQNGRRTRSVQDGKWQTLLVSIPDMGPTLFSG
ncbi:MAG: hypothetical protein JWM11_4789, partial [Planctomycetaceae bacterium]|nr:hypothetical protein [Planctomycetaceae bacterium]